jgi:glutaredoxin
MKTRHVKGRDKGDVMLYALSTCVWCKKTRRLLGDLGIKYSYVYVDLLPQKEQDEALDEVVRWNPDATFPTLVIDNSQCIAGYKPDALREKLG